jgi:GNAT superfamily N-acetyltransferase
MSSPDSAAHDVIRPARIEDASTIIEFNCRLARETEHRELDPDTIAAGVRAILLDSTKGRYFVAEAAGVVVGQMMHTWEWSDWRNGEIWWLQSVYVTPHHRGRGIFRRLFDHVRGLAVESPAVVGLRLYVERGNDSAQARYLKLGMVETTYFVLERMFDRAGLEHG